MVIKKRFDLKIFGRFQVVFANNFKAKILGGRKLWI